MPKLHVKTTLSVVLEDGRELEVSERPVDASDKDAFKFHRFPDGRTLVAYLTRDSDPMHPLDDVDGDGKIYRFTRDATITERNEGFEFVRTEDSEGRPMTPDPLAVILNKYEHSLTMWYVAGTSGHECRWDTSRGAGVWVPDDCAREAIVERAAKAVKDGDAEALRKEQRRLAEEIASIGCERYTSYVNGDCYRNVFEWCKPSGELEEPDDFGEQRGPYYGRQEAEDCLKEDFDEQVKLHTKDPDEPGP